MNQDTGWKEELGNNWHQLATDERAKVGGCECGEEKGICQERLTRFIESLLTQARAEERKKVIAEIRASLESFSCDCGMTPCKTNRTLVAIDDYLRGIADKPLSPVEERQPKNQ